MSKPINQDNLNASLRMLNKVGEANMEQLRAVDSQQAARMEQLGELFRKEGFSEQFLACPDKQTAIRLFAHHGFTTTEDGIDILIHVINTMAQKLLDNNGELSEEELEQIAGGASIFGFLGGAFMGGIGGFVLGTLVSLVCPPLSFAVAAGVGSAVLGITTGAFCADELEKSGFP